MSKLTQFIDRTFYPGQNRETAHENFRDQILAQVRPEMRVLDFGAGRGGKPELSFQGQVAQVCGADVDPVVKDNIYLDEARVIENDRIPYPDEAFDFVFSSFVLEHVEEPLSVFNEIFRVLKPGGRFLTRMPNRRHYVAIISAMTPHAFHDFVNRRRGRMSHDTFPTYYRVNTPRVIRRFALESGFDVVDINFHEGRPEYARLLFPAYLCGLIYERTVNATDQLGWLRAIIGALLEKPLDSGADSDSKL